MAHVIVELTRQGAEFESAEDAEATVKATLRALRACISKGEARDIAQPLPAKFGKVLTERETETAKPLPLGEFIGLVADETGVSKDEAEARIRAVVAALKQAVGEGEISNAEDQLPPEYGRLFEVGPEIHAESFSAAVAERTQFSMRESEVATRAVLETLAERIARGEGEDIAHFLDGDAADWIVDDENAEAESFGSDVFLERVARRADVDDATAREYVDAVMACLDAVVPDAELDRAGAQLPPAYEDLLAPAV